MRRTKKPDFVGVLRQTFETPEGPILPAPGNHTETHPF